MKVLTNENKIVSIKKLINNKTYKLISFDGRESIETPSFDVRLTKIKTYEVRFV